MVLNEFCPAFPQEWATIYELSKNHFLITLACPVSQQQISKLDQELVPGYRNVAYLCDGPVRVGLPQKSVEMFETWDGHAQSLFVLLYQDLAKKEC